MSDLQEQDELLVVVGPDAPSTKEREEAEARERAEALEREHREAEERAAALMALNADAKPTFNDEPTVIMAAIGPTMQAELTAAGLGGEPIFIGEDRIQVPHDVGADTLAAIRKVIAAHDAEAGRMPALRQSAFEAAMGYGNAITAKVTSQYADVEVQSWTAQEAEARTVLAGGTLPNTAMLPHLASDRGIDLAAYAQSVVEKADAYRMIAVAAVRLRRGAEGLLSDAIDTPEKLDAAVEALRAETLSAAKAVGIEI
ncbi:hypothetical protein [Methylobacterium longum]|uniref:Uncharacterized protein n=1 Tax=Methylobacterium longum TaxID=767694 RepID=A0ABT8AR16_9HYPH|nr:hypothetical protein [Methylobacterium longum]MDN3571799.1 hypothetical protein [Methylobacterium longum]GJE14000.1 hypothetical protein FOHLNKBM_5069 [Methylobacterium longum]